MNRLIVILLVISGLWMGYWVVGSTALERGMSAWIDARRAEGWAADVGEIDVAGFPNRFDSTLTDVHLADPETGVAWSAPFFQILALSYRPNQVIAVWPDEHVLSTPLQTITFTSDRARGSVYLEASSALALDRATIVTDALRMRSTLGWTVTLEEGRFATEQIPARENAHRIGTEMAGLTPSLATRSLLDPAGVLPDTIERVHLDASVGFTAPWDRFALEEARPQVTDIDLQDLSARWGDVTFRAAGSLSVDADGVPEGRITIRAVEWRRLLDMAVATGLVAEALGPTLERALELMASLSGRKDTLDAPLTFQKGFVSFGPIPLGPAPRLLIR